MAENSIKIAGNTYPLGANDTTKVEQKSGIKPKSKPEPKVDPKYKRPIHLDSNTGPKTFAENVTTNNPSIFNNYNIV